MKEPPGWCDPIKKLTHSQLCFRESQNSPKHSSSQFTSVACLFAWLAPTRSATSGRVATRRKSSGIRPGMSRVPARDQAQMILFHLRINCLWSLLIIRSANLEKIGSLTDQFKKEISSHARIWQWAYRDLWNRDWLYKMVDITPHLVSQIKLPKKG